MTKPNNAPPLTITALKAERYKNLRAVDLKFDGARFVQVTGRNGAGKSSILDAITTALRGRKGKLDQSPVMRGEDSAEVVVEIGTKYRVRKHYGADGKERLTVESLEGMKYSSPQSLLDDLFSDVGFDPEEMSRMDPRQQQETIQRLVGLDTSDLDIQAKTLFDQRTDINRDLKAARARLEAIAPVKDDVPPAEIPASVLVERLKAARAEHEKAATARHRVHSAETARDIAVNRVLELRRQLADAEAQVVEHEESLANLRRFVPAPESLPDLDAITHEVETADLTNRLVRQKRQRAELVLDVAALQKQAEERTERLAELDAAKAQRRQDTEYPLPGMGVTDEGIVLNDVPIAQISQAEALSLWTAVGFALNKGLRLVTIKAGSLLDDEHKAIVAREAERHGGQVIVECVSNGDGKVGAKGIVGIEIEMESGAVKAVEQLTEVQ